MLAHVHHRFCARRRQRSAAGVRLGWCNAIGCLSCEAGKLALRVLPSRRTLQLACGRYYVISVYHCVSTFGSKCNTMEPWLLPRIHSISQHRHWACWVALAEQWKALGSPSEDHGLATRHPQRVPGPAKQQCNSNCKSDPIYPSSTSVGCQPTARLPLKVSIPFLLKPCRLPTYSPSTPQSFHPIPP